MEWGYSAEPISVHLDRLPDTGYVSISPDHNPLILGHTSLGCASCGISPCSRLLLFLPVVLRFNAFCRTIWRTTGSVLQSLCDCMIRRQKDRPLLTQVTSLNSRDMQARRRGLCYWIEGVFSVLASTCTNRFALCLQFFKWSAGQGGWHSTVYCVPCKCCALYI